MSQENEEFLNCIFGENIKNPCPVRQELNQRMNAQKKLENIVQKKGGMAEEFAAAFNGFANSVSGELTALVDFCAICPFLNASTCGKE